MLETVRIRQAGYNVRLNYDEFIHLYRILLPKGLKSDRPDVESFLLSLHLNPSNYQLGEHKVFLRETEKIKLDYFLHQQILASIVCIQRLYRAILERRHFLRVQEAIVTLQSYVRMFLAQRLVANMRIMHLAATYIQKMWRGHRVRKWYQNLRKTCVQFQARARGNILRERFQTILDNHRRLSKEKNVMDSAIEENHKPAVAKPVNDLYFTPGLTKDAEELDSAIIRKPKSKPSLESYETKPQFLLSPVAEERKLRRAAPLVMTDINDDSAEWDSTGSPKKDNKNTPAKTPSSKNAFHRAKKHIRTIMISGNAKTKLEKHEATLLESGSEAEDNEPFSAHSKISSLPSKSKLNSLKSSQSSDTISSMVSSASSKKSVLQLRHTRSLKTMVDTSLLKHSESPSINNSSKQGMFSNEPDPSKFNIIHSEHRISKNSTVALDNTSPYGHSTKSGNDRVGGDRKYQIYEDSLSKNGFETSVRYNQYVRRESDGVVSLNFSDVRRSSRDSAQSYNIDLSPSVSSQDSLFYYGSNNSKNGPNGPSDMRRYDKSTGSSGVSGSHTPIFGTTSYNRRPSKTNVNSGGSSLEVNSGREIRRSRSVSETRGSNGSLNDSNRVEFILSESTPEIAPTEAGDELGNLKKLGYHALDKVSKFHRGDSCSACKKSMHAVLSPGRKCFECKSYFHDKCIDNGAILHHICEHRNKNSFGKTTRSKTETIGRRLKRKQSKTHVDTSIKQNFSLTGTSEFTDAADQIISDVRELQLMQEFISAKIFQVSNKEGEKSSLVDKVFQQALREFKESLVSSFSVATKQGGIMQLSITYKDLISYFANIMETVCKQEGIGSDFPATMGVNALRGFLNEFMNDNRVEEKPKLTKGRKKVKRNKRQKGDETINYLGHAFVTMVVYIPTACEICSSFIMWPIERGVVCQKCKLACHKKCHLKLQIECNDSRGNNNCSDCGVFGSPLESLIPENGTVPPVVEQLVSVIEFYGLRQEGLYRKSGVSSSVKELKNDIKEGKKIEWESYSVHVFTSVLKSFFRELPEPLLTFELYDEFLRAADMSRIEERIHTIFSLLKKLPKPNYDLTERLVFHLVRVAMYESNNRMNANSLAIVFAPCILRTNKTRQVQESLTDISRQTSCLETIIAEQLKKFKSTWSNIESVDSAAHSFSGRLNSIRTRGPSERLTAFPGSSSSLKNPSPESTCNIPAVPDSNMSKEEEVEYLQRHIAHLKNEKAILTTLLPSLSVSRSPSDEEMLSTDPEVESSAGSVDDLHRDSLSSPTQARTTFPDKSSDCSGLATCQECLSTSQSRQPGPSLLPHNVIKTKNRGPVRKAPSRFVRNQFSVVNFGEDDEEDMYDLNSDLEDSKDQSNDDDEEDEEGAILV